MNVILQILKISLLKENLRKLQKSTKLKNLNCFNLPQMRYQMLFLILKKGLIKKAEIFFTLVTHKFVEV